MRAATTPKPTTPSVPSRVVFVERFAEQYVLVFRRGDADQAAEAARVVARWAADPRLSLSHADAAVIAQRIIDGPAS